MLIIVLLFLVILSVLVFVHEFGHFSMARLFGMRVDEFGFGFPPRALGFWKDPKTNTWKVIGSKVDRKPRTIYSLNWIPLGGFVRIKGEDGNGRKEKDSFASSPGWKRIIVLSAGVIMNFILAWVLFSFVFMLGAPQAVTSDESMRGETSVQVGNVLPNTPAEEMGLRIGDTLLGRYVETDRDEEEKAYYTPLNTISDVQEYVEMNKGGEIRFLVKRGDEQFPLSGIPRSEYPEGEGSLGIELVRTSIVSYPWYEAIWKGLMTVFMLIGAILVAFWGLLKTLFTTGSTPADIAGPVGIAFYTKQVADLGFVYILQFAGILSVNLGIINILPIPALDGGRVVFVLVEMIKGSPVSQKVEQAVHSVGFILLLLLMLVVTLFDFVRFDIIGRIFS
jgi:regulator of sigma E protease